MGHAGDCLVVKRVACCLGKGAVLSPAGQPPVNDPWISREKCLGPQSESFRHARSERLKKNFSLLSETENRFHTFRVLEVYAD